MTDVEKHALDIFLYLFEKRKQDKEFIGSLISCQNNSTKCYVSALNAQNKILLFYNTNTSSYFSCDEIPTQKIIAIFFFSQQEPTNIKNIFELPTTFITNILNLINFI